MCCDHHWPAPVCSSFLLRVFFVRRSADAKHRSTRSLVATLRAAKQFEKSHLSSPTVAPLVQGAEMFYVEGFFLTHGAESALELSKHASENNKV